MTGIDWKHHIEEQRKSGLSAAEYCRRAGVAAGQFLYRRSVGREGGKFVRVDTGKVGSMEIELPSGMKLRIPLEKEVIREVLGVLHALG